MSRSRKTKKGKRNWKINQRKTRRQKGLSYVNVQGTEVPAKEFENVDCLCPLGCIYKVPVEGRKFLFDDFYNLTSRESKIVYIRGLVDRFNVKRRRSKDPSNFKRANFLYRLKFSLDGRPFNVAVCRGFFCQTFQLNARTLLNWIKPESATEATENKKLGVPSPRKVDSSNVLEFLKNLPHYDSHYARQRNSTKVYLEPGLTYTKLYKMYSEHRQNINGNVDVTMNKFVEIFQTETNIYIKHLHHDTCATCDELNVKIKSSAGSKRTKLVATLSAHHKEVTDTKQMFDYDKAASDQNSVMITFDLQKALPLPVLTSGPSYYARNFYVYNLGIHSYGDNKEPQMFVWDESQGSRGAQEIASCLVKFLTKNTSKINRLTLYCDRCGAQNRNIKLTLALMRHLSNPLVETSIIDLKFVVSGHSWLPNDRDFGIIEKSIEKHEQIYVPPQYHNIIQECRNPPFVVEKLSREDFYSTKKLEDAITNRKKSTDGEKIDWMKIGWIRITKSSPLAIQIKENLNEEFKTVSLLKRGCGIKNLFEIVPDLLYVDDRQISIEKHQNLSTLLKFIPEEHRSFYQNLHVSNT